MRRKYFFLEASLEFNLKILLAIKSVIFVENSNMKKYFILIALTSLIYCVQAQDITDTLRMDWEAYDPPSTLVVINQTNGFYEYASGSQSQRKRRGAIKSHDG